MRDKNGRFVKGINPWNKGTKGIMKAWNKDKKDIYTAKQKDQISKTLKEKYKTGKIIHPYLNKHHTPETKEKIRKTKIKEYKENPELRRKLSLINKGEKSNLWRGGLTSANQRIRASFEYRLWRKAVFERDNYTCIWCGKKFIKGVTGKVMLNADHIKPFALYPELRFAIDNGRTLCEECHKTTDSYFTNKKGVTK